MLFFLMMTIKIELKVEMELVMLMSCVWLTFPMFGDISKDAGKLFSNTRAEANISMFCYSELDPAFSVYKIGG